MTPARSTEGQGGKGIDLRTRLATPCLPLATSKHACLPAASSQTPLDCPALYKIHTFVCWLYTLDYRAYNALEGWVATCVPTAP